MRRFVSKVSKAVLLVVEQPSDEGNLDKGLDSQETYEGTITASDIVDWLGTKGIKVRLEHSAQSFYQMELPSL